MGEKMSKTVMVNRNISDVYRLWANFENFPNFMRHIKEVRKTSDQQSHWIMEGPMGKQIEWDARTTTMEPNRRIAWQSTGGDIETTGEVTFKEISSNQTEVTVVLQYTAKGTFQDTIAKYFVNSDDWLEEDLRNFKRYAESMGGGVTGTRGTPGRYEEETMRTGGTGSERESYRERAGAGAFGSTPGGPMGTPTGGSIGGTTRGTMGGTTDTGGTVKPGGGERPTGDTGRTGDVNRGARDRDERDRNRGGNI